MINRLLVANRGEIASRVFATCRALGIETVAVYSDPDGQAPFLAEADQAVRLPGSTAVDTYLRGDLIVAAARRAEADAVHPGYGFLAENAEFAQAVLDAGLTWVGPPPKAIAVMGSKLEAKALLADAGVPMLPSGTDPAAVTEFPVLVKASAGGGGRGMRVVRRPAELAEAVAAASREAAAAFGDGTVFCERYLESARHVEVQILADAHGTVVALGERECSIQRRHQKIIEECPSPAVNEALRERLYAAAVAAARAVGYTGAGTVEFLLTGSGEFFFLEMNTRLQVEHPVTECVFGLDLVRLQLLVAEGEPLPFRGAPPMTGHAIEARLYAEDPADGWLPSTGRLHRFEVAGTPFARPAGPGLRLDAGVRTGSVVSPYYDPMLAKLIAWAPSRGEAARLLAGGLAWARLHGVATNRDLLVRVLRDTEFLAGGTDTAFLDRHPEVFTPLLAGGVDLACSALAAALAGAAARRAAAPSFGSLPSGWRNVPSAEQRVSFTGPAGPIEVGYRLDRDGQLADWSVTGTGTGPGSGARPATVTLVRAEPERVVLDVDGVCRAFSVDRESAAGGTADRYHVDGVGGAVTLVKLPRFPLPRSTAPAGSLLAPMPGTVGRVLVAAGQPVEAGDLLLTVEAMKLEHAVHAPAAGVVTELSVAPGAQVDAGTVLVLITPAE